METQAEHPHKSDLSQAYIPSGMSAGSEVDIPQQRGGKFPPPFARGLTHSHGAASLMPRAYGLTLVISVDAASRSSHSLHFERQTRD